MRISSRQLSMLVSPHCINTPCECVTLAFGFNANALPLHQHSMRMRNPCIRIECEWVIIALGLNASCHCILGIVSHLQPFLRYVFHICASTRFRW